MPKIKWDGYYWNDLGQVMYVVHGRVGDRHAQYTSANMSRPAMEHAIQRVQQLLEVHVCAVA